MAQKKNHKTTARKSLRRNQRNTSLLPITNNIINKKQRLANRKHPTSSPTRSSCQHLSKQNNTNQLTFKPSPTSSPTLVKSNASPSQPKRTHHRQQHQQNIEQQPEPNTEWVRHLLSLRRSIISKSVCAPDSASKDWLDEQHRWLGRKTMPVMLKCVLAASAISKRFTQCAPDFMKPEYRARYWEWSCCLIMLLDFRIRMGHVDVFRSNVDQVDKRMIKFLRLAKEHERTGALTPHKELLLKSLGVKLELVRDENDENVNNSNTNQLCDDDDDEDEDDDVVKILPHGRNRRVEEEEDDDRHVVQISRFDNGKKKKSSKRYNNNNNNSNTAELRAPEKKLVEQWSRNFIRLRQYFKRGTAGYDIPEDETQLWIWMNAESARSSTGTLSMYCCGVLKAGKVVDGIDTISISKCCYEWCIRFVQLVDFLLSCQKRIDMDNLLDTGVTYISKCGNGLVQFVVKCFEDVCGRVLGCAKDGLLSGIDRNWENCRFTKVCVNRVKYIGNYDDDGGDEQDVVGMAEWVRRSRQTSTGMPIEGEEEDIIESQDGKKRERRHSNSTDGDMVCEKMVSSMIKGMVAEVTGGRPRTVDEKDAQAWVERAGVQALNQFAQHWVNSIGS